MNNKTVKILVSIFFFPVGLLIWFWKGDEKDTSNSWRKDPVSDAQKRYMYNLLEDYTVKELVAKFGVKKGEYKDDTIFNVMRLHCKNKGTASDFITQLTGKSDLTREVSIP